MLGVISSKNKEEKSKYIFQFEMPLRMHKVVYNSLALYAETALT